MWEGEPGLKKTGEDGGRDGEKEFVKGSEGQWGKGDCGEGTQESRGVWGRGGEED